MTGELERRGEGEGGFAGRCIQGDGTVCGLLEDVNDDTNQSRENIAIIHDTLITNTTLH